MPVFAARVLPAILALCLTVTSFTAVTTVPQLAWAHEQPAAQLV